MHGAERLGMTWWGRQTKFKFISTQNDARTPASYQLDSMAPTAGKAADELTLLKSTVDATLALIQTLQPACGPSSAPASPPTPLVLTPTSEQSLEEATDPERNIQAPKNVPQNPKVNALALAHDTASLIKAHSTKLSLLIINKPFTPTAIVKVLQELVAGPLPGLATAIELCDGNLYTKAMRTELLWRAKRLLNELSSFLKAIPLDGQILDEGQKNGTGSMGGKGSLASTAVVWKACDSVMELKNLGVAGFMIQKAEQYRDLVRDALDELLEWSQEDSDEEDDVEDSADENEVENEAQDAVDALFGSHKHIPKDDTENIRERLNSTVKRLRLMVLMYQAVVKRRLRTLPALPQLEPSAEKGPLGDPGVIACLDVVVERMKKITEDTDEVAIAFYDLSAKDIDMRMDQCFFLGFATVELLIKNWEGEEDEFTDWVRFASCTHWHLLTLASGAEIPGRDEKGLVIAEKIRKRRPPHLASRRTMCSSTRCYMCLIITARTMDSCCSRRF